MRTLLLAAGLLVLVAITAGLLQWRGANDASANPFTGASDVAAGDTHTCALTSAGGVECWGGNSLGQLGDGTLANRFSPVGVVGLASGVASVAAGPEHTCAVTTGGGVKCWGRNLVGQLGDGTAADRSTPVDVVGLLSGVASVTAGRGYTCAVTTGGGVKCWGSGPLGNGTTTASSTPVDVPALSSGVVALAAADDHTCAVTTGGGVKCWGSNSRGRLGDGSLATRLSPVGVVGLASGVSSVAAGAEHTCAVTTGGGVKCWGRNDFGQLGAETTELCPADFTGFVRCSTTPVDVEGLTSGVAAIAAGVDHTCALLASGGVECWGGNDFGQLGDGQDCGLACQTPVGVVGLSTAGALATGTVHSCAVVGGSAVECWGINQAGQLGTLTFERCGPAACSTTPVAVTIAKPAPTPSPCPPSGCPTPTPLPITPIPSAGMSLLAPGVVFAGDPFVLTIAANSAPGVQISGFASEVLFPSELIWLQRPSCEDEVQVERADGGQLAFCSAGVTPLLAGAGHAVQSEVANPAGPLNVAPGSVAPLLALDFVCGVPGSHTFILTAVPDSPFGALYADALSNEILVRTEPFDYDGDTVPNDVADTLTITCVDAPTPTPTPTPMPFPRVQKLPAQQNLFLTAQGVKLAPLTCAQGTDSVVLQELLSAPVTTLDPKTEPLSPPAQPGGTATQQLAGFEVQVRFDPKLVCVNIEPGPAAANMFCVVKDKDSSVLEGIASIHCATQKGQSFPDTTATAGRHLADVIVRPQPDAYSFIIANQENGIVAQIIDQDCRLTDQLGHPIPIASCEDADVTIRYLEGDVNADCAVNALDQQQLAFRWGSQLGNLIYNARYDVEPAASVGANTTGDGDIDINDLQFVFGRHLSQCAAPNPAQPPVNPKAVPTPTPTPTPTVTPTATPTITPTPTPVIVTLQIDSLTLSSGQEGTVDVRVLDVPPPGIGSWQIGVLVGGFGLSGIQFADAPSCTAHPVGFCQAADPQPSLLLTGAGPSGLVGTTTLATVTFACDTGGSAPLSLILFSLITPLADGSNPILADIQNGSLTCLGPTATPTATPTPAPTPIRTLLQIDSLTLQVGQEGTVDVRAVDVLPPGIGEWQLLIFWPGFAQATGCTPLAGTLCNVVIPPFFGLSGSGFNGLIGTTTLGTITFRCDAGGSGPLGIAVAVLRSPTSDGSAPLSASIQSGTLTCLGPTPTPTPTPTVTPSP